MFKYVKKLLALLTKEERRKLVLVFILILLLGFLELAGIGSIMPFLSVATNPESIETNKYLSWAYNYFNFETHTQYITTLGVLFVVFLLISNGARAMITYITKRYSAMRKYALSKRLLQHYVFQPYTFFLDHNSSELQKNVLNEVNMVIQKAMYPGLTMVAQAIVSLFIIGLLMSVDPLIAVLVAVVLGFSYALIYLFVRKILHRIGKERVEASRAQFKGVSEVLGGIKDVKILHKEDNFIGQFAMPSKKLAKIGVTNELIGELPRYVLETVAFGGIVVLLLFMLHSQGSLDDAIPMIGLYALAGYRLMPSLQAVFRGATNLRYNIPAVELLYRHLHSGERIKVYKGEPLPLKKELKLENITFYYPNTSKPVIDNQTISIQANTTVGFVGPTGCGKTTLIDIVLGLLTPQEGSIIVDDKKIKGKDIYRWQASLGYVQQNIYLSDNTVAKNIAFGVEDSAIDYTLVKNAASVANIDRFIEEELPKGYNTIIGERGIRLSGGQRQRLGIARAVYNNPPVLILDEATSALDGFTEDAIMEAIHSLSGKKTILMIAHRITTLRECSTIFMLRNGKIIDSGSYEELYERNADFRQLADGKKQEQKETGY